MNKIDQKLKEKIKRSALYNMEIDKALLIVVGIICYLTCQINYLYDIWILVMLLEASLIGISVLILSYKIYKTTKEKSWKGEIWIFKFWKVIKTKKFAFKIIAVICFIFINVWLINTSLSPFSYEIATNSYYFAIFFGFLYGISKIMNYERLSYSVKKIAEGEVFYQIDEKYGELKENGENLKKIANVFECAAEEKLKSERLKTDLITNVSHDIKTPLTSIINYIGLLKKEEVSNEKSRKYIKVIEKKANRLKCLTEDLVEVSKLSSGNEELKLEEVNLAQMILQANGEFAEKFEEKKLEIISKIEANKILAKVDNRKMGRVWENLYQNVYKYAMNGTRVYIELKREKQEIVFRMKNISKERLNIPVEKLTQRFIKGDSSRHTKGNGLGLAIVQSLIKLHQGIFKIYIEGDLFMTEIRLPIV